MFATKMKTEIGMRGSDIGAMGGSTVTLGTLPCSLRLHATENEVEASSSSSLCSESGSDGFRNTSSTMSSVGTGSPLLSPIPAECTLDSEDSSQEEDEDDDDGWEDIEDDEDFITFQDEIPPDCSISFAPHKTHSCSLSRPVFVVAPKICILRAMFIPRPNGFLQICRKRISKEKERPSQVLPDSTSMSESMEPSSSSSICTKDKPSRILKKVRFDDKNLVKVVEFEDDEESRLNRKLFWEFFAVDRARFKERILRSEEVVSPILRRDHREKVYNGRTSGYLARATEQEEERMTNPLQKSICSPKIK